MQQDMIAPNTVACWRCGRVGLAGDAFCGQCGASLQASTFRPIDSQTLSLPKEQGGIPWKALILACGIIAAASIVWTEITHITSTPPQSKHALVKADSVPKVRPKHPYYYPLGDITFRHVGAEWVRNDVAYADLCAGHDPEIIAGDPSAFYPEVCMLTADDATAADKWYAKRHPGWNAEAANQADRAREDAWTKAHPDTTPHTSLQQSTATVSTQNTAPRIESEDQFVFMLTNTLSAMTTVDRNTAETVAQHEYVRCTQAGFITEDQLNDCVINHPDEEMVDLPRGTF